MMASYLISDLHLSPGRTDLVAAFLGFCQQIEQDAEQLFILGDFFDAWIGDDAAPAGLFPIQQALLRLSQQGCSLYFVHGNRDFLVGDQLAQSCQMTILPEQSIQRIQDQDVILLHGDELCTDDHDYQRFRQWVRNPDWQADFLSKPPEQRLAMAKEARMQSQSQGQLKSEAIMDTNDLAVEACFNQHQRLLMVHGHTHRPKRHIHWLGGQQGIRWVLGDWDQTLNYLRVQGTAWDYVCRPI